MSAIRQAICILLLAAVPALIAAGWHPRRPAWDENSLRPGEVSLDSAKGWGTDALWVDARPPDDFSRGHIPGAVSLTLEGWEQALPAFLDAWHPGQRVVVYCSSIACGLSQEVAERLRRNGVEPVYVLKGGWEAWQQQ